MGDVGKTHIVDFDRERELIFNVDLNNVEVQVVRPGRRVERYRLVDFPFDDEILFQESLDALNQQVLRNPQEVDSDVLDLVSKAQRTEDMHLRLEYGLL